ncbi:hypothetical protein EMCRGX_G027384 [Ephydatia muelleri]
MAVGVNPDPRAVIQVHIYLRCPKSLPVRPKAAPNHPHAGRCNGVKARCKFLYVRQAQASLLRLPPRQAWEVPQFHCIAAFFAIVPISSFINSTAVIIASLYRTAGTNSFALSAAVFTASYPSEESQTSNTTQGIRPNLSSPPRPPLAASPHAPGCALPGEIPSAWLMERNLFICPNCYQLVLLPCNQSSIVNARQSLAYSPSLDSTFEQAKHPPFPPPVTFNPDFDILYVLRSFPKGSGAGPSCLSAQHLLDAASIPLPTPIASSLRSVVNLLVSGKVPLPVSVFLAGDTILDPLGHHAVSCRHGGFFGHTAQLPEGHFGRLLPQDSPAGEDRDLGWDRGHPAAFDVTVISPLTPATLNFSAVTEGAAAQAAEERKHASNDAKCEDLGWTCIPLAVESYGNWGKEARDVFNRLASLLAFGHSSTKPRLLTEIYSHLNMSLARSAAKAIMAPNTCEHCEGLHSAMDSNDPWHINEKDNVGGHQNVSTNLFRAVVKCSKCRLKGHIAAHCTNPKRIDVCHLCGEGIHSEESCNKKMCPHCFRRWHTGKCILSLSVPSELCQCCHRWGHSETVCSDIWRQFHNTTDTKDLFRLSIEQQRQTRRVFCCICAAEGHFGYECHLVHPMEKPYSPLVTQYGHQRSQAKRHTSANTSTASSIPSIQTHRNDISYKNTQSSDVSKDSWPVLHSLPKCAFTASCVSQREDICAPPFVQPEPWPVL